MCWSANRTDGARHHPSRYWTADRVATGGRMVPGPIRPLTPVLRAVAGVQDREDLAAFGDHVDGGGLGSCRCRQAGSDLFVVVVQRETHAAATNHGRGD